MLVHFFLPQTRRYAARDHAARVNLGEPLGIDQRE
jgi:hypothetical protein